MSEQLVADPDVCGPQTWEEIGFDIQPIVVAKYNLDEPYHPDKANMDWKVTVIHVALIGPNNYGFYDQDGYCLNPCAVFWGRLPTPDEILTFLQEVE